jgi:hypothetical protein
MQVHGASTTAVVQDCGLPRCSMLCVPLHASQRTTHTCNEGPSWPRCESMSWMHGCKAPTAKNDSRSDTGGYVWVVFFSRPRDVSVYKEDLCRVHGGCVDQVHAITCANAYMTEQERTCAPSAPTVADDASCHPVRSGTAGEAGDCATANATIDVMNAAGTIVPLVR